MPPITEFSGGQGRDGGHLGQCARARKWVLPAGRGSDCAQEGGAAGPAGCAPRTPAGTTSTPTPSRHRLGTACAHSRPCGGLPVVWLHRPALPMVPVARCPLRGAASADGGGVSSRLPEGLAPGNQSHTKKRLPMLRRTLFPLRPVLQKAKRTAFVKRGGQPYCSSSYDICGLQEHLRNKLPWEKSKFWSILKQGFYTFQTAERGQEDVT